MITVVKPGIRLKGTCSNCGCEVECLPGDAIRRTITRTDPTPFEAAYGERKTYLAVNCPECVDEREIVMVSPQTADVPAMAEAGIV